MENPFRSGRLSAAPVLPTEQRNSVNLEAQRVRINSPILLWDTGSVTLEGPKSEVRLALQ